LAALIFLFATFGGPSAGAMGLCDCCSGAALTPDCQSACGAAKEEIPMCRPVVIYDGDAGAPPGDNALAVGSLKYLSMGRPDRPALERFRQWFELWRSRAEEKFQAALASDQSGAGSDAKFARAEAERDQVLVNYQHGMRRYVEILRADGAAPRLSARVVLPRREMNRSKRVARQKIARQKVVQQKVVQQKVVQQKVVQQKVVRVALRTAKVCTGNWVNAACAAP
jgi:hypothetical protein